jgi:hypothetical protein
MKLAFRPFVLLTVVLGAVIVASGIASANHSWGNYHWARTSNPFTLKIGDNVSAAWDSYLATASSDWTQSTVLDTAIVSGSANPKNCRPTSGRVEVCNSSYGNNGWLGIAQIWITGGVHIAQGAVKVNDFYFNQPRYNTPEWRNFVMCQEVGHTLGLAHQDENFNNADLLDQSDHGSCMDYSSDPSNNQHPNQHDYDELEIIYNDHLDSTTTLNAATVSRGNTNLDDPSAWGRIVRAAADGRSVLYERDFGGGNKVFTFVIWAQ